MVRIYALGRLEYSPNAIAAKYNTGNRFLESLWELFGVALPRTRRY